MPLTLSTPVKFIKRVGERVAANLATRGVVTVEDLLYHLPFRYEDRLHPKPLSAYRPGDMASLIGEVRGTILLRTRSAPIFEMTVGITPPTGAGTPHLDSETWGTTDASMAGLLQPPSPILETVKCMWFHGTYLKDKFRPGERIALYGKLEASRSGNALNAAPGQTRFKMIQPTFEILPADDATGDDAEFTILEMGRIVPVYESLGGTTPWGAKLTSRWLRRILWTIFKDLSETTTPGGPSVPLHGTGRVGAKQVTDTSASPTARPKAALKGTGFSPSITSNRKIGALAPEGTDASADHDTIPPPLLQRLQLPSRSQALQDLHFPPAGTSLDELAAARTPAHRRLIFEEFFYLELGLELKRRRLRERAGTAFLTDEKVREALKQVLPFKPTAAQKRVLGEIVADMRRPQPMRRLLQGDVGSGKTIVAFQAALIAIENGTQVAMMAPTEILATQHYLAARRLLADKLSPRTARPYRIALLTGSLDDRTKRDTRARLARGEIDLAIGTHALVEDSVDFARLGLVIVDEQHRFGVQQRFQLMRKPNTNVAQQPDLQEKTVIRSETSAQASKGTNPSALKGTGFSPSMKDAGKKGALAPEGADASRPQAGNMSAEPDVLVMTATPIPRTLALTLYGDLEASVLDELPPGRTPIVTRRVAEDRSAEVWDFVRKQAAAGHQAYIVYPIVEGPTTDQPELDFADLGVEGGFSPLSSAQDSPGFSPGDAPTNADTPSAKGATHNSLGRSPKLQTKKVKRAEGPTQKAATTPRAKANRQPLRSATDMHAHLSSGPLKGLKLGLLHGRMSADDKDVTMARFKRGELDVLVATTVIEVGVDVPNATVMVIEHAERFGLSQLHQLRGRVGRGAAKSFCILLTGASVTPDAEQRLDAMVRTQNGFELAELDLQLRGPGEFFGTRQAGLPDLRVASLTRDRDLLELAKTEAARFAASPDPTLTPAEIAAVWTRLKLQWQRRYGLVEA